jgi:hypothetical protein
MKYVTRFLEAAIVLAFVFLIVSNLRLRAEVKNLRREQTLVASSLQSFQAGDEFDAGKLVPCRGCATAPYPAGPKMVIIVNPSCESCEEAVHDLELILPTLRMPPVVVSTVGDPATSEFARKHHFGRFTYLIAPKADRKRFLTAPQVFLVNDSKVIARCRSVNQCLPRNAT